MVGTVPVLLLLNGPPGVGKSTLARGWAESLRLALVVEVDGLRASLGGWRDDPTSMVVARDLALVLVRSHLEAGHDVVVPQYLGRLPFISALADVAAACGARFVEVVLRLDADVCVERFRARRAAGGAGHPEVDVPDSAVESVVADAVARLTEVVAARPTTVVVDAGLDCLHDLLAAS